MIGDQPELGAAEPVPVKIAVPGDPVPLARPKGRIAGKPPRQWIQFYTPKQSTDAQSRIAIAWQNAGHERFAPGIPLVLRTIFVFARPDGHFGTGRNAATVKPQHVSRRPGGRGNTNTRDQRTGGDLDNCVKLVADALNEIAYADDGQIVQIEASKLFCDQAGVEAPATLIELRELLP